MKQTLYNITEEHQRLLQAIENNDGEITNEIAEQFNITNEHFEEKAVSYGYVIKSVEDESELIAKEIKRLGELKKKADKQSEFLRYKLSEAMQMFGFDEIKKNNLRLFFRKSKAVEIENEDLIPVEYCTIIPEQKKPDKTAIKGAIENIGVKVPGAIVVEKKSLQIK